MANPLAFYGTELMTAAKSFLLQVHENALKIIKNERVREDRDKERDKRKKRRLK